VIARQTPDPVEPRRRQVSPEGNPFAALFGEQARGFGPIFVTKRGDDALRSGRTQIDHVNGFRRPVMRTMRPMMIALLFAAVLPANSSAQGDKKPVDLTGRWSFSVQSDVGTGTPGVTFAQKGDSISGRYSSQSLGERDFTGTFKDGKVEFGFSAEVQGQQFSMWFSGTMDGADAMKGSIDFGGMATGTFSGKRQKP
jgi:hypothetical protein